MARKRHPRRRTRSRFQNKGDEMAKRHHSYALIIAGLVGAVPVFAQQSDPLDNVQILITQRNFQAAYAAANAVRLENPRSGRAIYLTAYSACRLRGRQAEGLALARRYASAGELSAAQRLAGNQLVAFCSPFAGQGSAGSGGKADGGGHASSSGAAHTRGDR